MSATERFQQDLKGAMRARDKTRVGTVRLLVAAIRNAEIARTDPKNRDHGKPLDEAAVVGIIRREARQRRESIEAFEKGGRTDLVEKEQAELAILEAYLPAQLSREEIAVVVGKLIAELGPELRKVMPRAQQELRGRAEGGAIAGVVRDLTS